MGLLGSPHSHCYLSRRISSVLIRVVATAQTVLQGSLEGLGQIAFVRGLPELDLQSAVSAGHPAMGVAVLVAHGESPERVSTGIPAGCRIQLGHI